MNRAAYAIAAILLLVALYMVETRSPKEAGDAAVTRALIEDYATARPLFWQRVYSNGGDTLYCGMRFNSRDRTGINIEHVFPMSWVKNALDCGTRKQCQQRSKLFNIIEADLHNLYPSRADVNQARASFRFGEIAGEQRRYGSNCDFEVSTRDRVVEPAPAVRGNIARAMFYMARRYGKQGLVIFDRQGRLLHKWHLSDPPDAQERVRNDLIEGLQGNRNPFIDNPQQLDELVADGYFF